LRRESTAANSRAGWLAGLRQWLLHLAGRQSSGGLRVVDHRRRHDNEETDLRGLNIRAVR